MPKVVRDGCHELVCVWDATRIHARPSRRLSMISHRAAVGTQRPRLSLADKSAGSEPASIKLRTSTGAQCRLFLRRSDRRRACCSVQHATPPSILCSILHTARYFRRSARSIRSRVQGEAIRRECGVPSVEACSGKPHAGCCESKKHSPDRIVFFSCHPGGGHFCRQPRAGIRFGRIGSGAARWCGDSVVSLLRSLRAPLCSTARATSAQQGVRSAAAPARTRLESINSARSWAHILDSAKWQGALADGARARRSAMQPLVETQEAKPLLRGLRSLPSER